MSALLELAERVEALTRPDRELEHAIGKLVGWSIQQGICGNECPRYTASLDAALSLVPEGWVLAALCEREPWFCRLETDDFDSLTFGKGGDWITEITAGEEVIGKAATPALALCAASLRARAAGESA